VPNIPHVKKGKKFPRIKNFYLTKFKKFVIIIIESEGNKMLGIMTKEYEDKFNRLVKEIMAEAEEDGEPVTEDEAKEMAKMELGAKDITNYTQATVKKERKKAERKADEDKAYLLETLQNALEDVEVSAVKPETEFSFEYKGNAYTVKLVKHRPPKK
jgi:hypothetical protein